MRHQAQHVARAIADAGDVITRTIGIGLGRDITFTVAIPEDYPIRSLKFCESCIVTNVVSLGMSNWKSQHCLRLQFIRKWRVGTFYTNVYMFANEMKVTIAYQGAGQETRLAEYLKAVADAQHKAARRGKLLY